MGTLSRCTVGGGLVLASLVGKYSRVPDSGLYAARPGYHFAWARVPAPRKQIRGGIKGPGPGTGTGTGTGDKDE